MAIDIRALENSDSCLKIPLMATVLLNIVHKELLPGANDRIFVRPGAE